MQKVKFYDKEQLDLTEIEALASLAHEAVKEIVRKFLFDGFCVFSGCSVTQNSVPNGQVLLGESLALQDGNIVYIPDQQTINILNNTGTWGTGVAASSSYPRYSIVCIKYVETETQNQLKWFLDDADPANPTEYQQSVITRIADSYDITVVHGTASASPVKPNVPDGYAKIAEILIPAGSVTVTTSNITSTAPATVPAIASHMLNTENPHSVLHSQTSPSAVDATKTDTAKDKHVSNSDMKAVSDHMSNGLMHLYIGNTTPNPSLVRLWIDNGTIPNQLKFWNGSFWEVINTLQ
jgi:hypothetical protein